VLEEIRNGFCRAILNGRGQHLKAAGPEFHLVPTQNANDFLAMWAISQDERQSHHLAPELAEQNLLTASQMDGELGRRAGQGAPE